jgi:hypothetical protein
MIDALDKRDGRALQEILLKHLHNKRDVVVMQLQIHANTSKDKNQKA